MGDPLAADLGKVILCVYPNFVVLQSPTYIFDKEWNGQILWNIGSRDPIQRANKKLGICYHTDFLTLTIVDSTQF